MALEDLLSPPAGSAPTFVEDDVSVSTGEFGARVRALAEHLRQRDISVGDRIAIVARKGVSTIALIYAALREGIIFVPVDPQSPPHRLRTILADCAPKLVVVDETTAGSVAAVPGFAGRLGSVSRIPGVPTLPTSGAAVEPDSLFTARHPGSAIAYLIYTSGSTGEPKGVAVPRSALDSFLRSARDRAGYDGATVFLSFFPLHFDPMLMEILLPWAVGGRTVLFGELRMINDLLTELRRHGITDFSCTPNVVSMLVGRFSALRKQPLPALRSVWLGGEQPNTADLRAFQRLAPGVRLFNGYGPTECVVACSLYELPDLSQAGDDYRIPIGRPFPGVRFVLVDEHDRPVDADDGAGNLLVGGAQLMAGYWGGRSGDDVFVRLPDGPYYRTGDLVDRTDGNYYFRGRSSRMIKIGGFRVHPAEVESALLTLAGVSAAVVLFDEERRQLVAMVESAEQVDQRDCADHLAERVPGYMIPKLIVIMSRLPRLTNGKLDLSGVRERLLVDAP